MCVSRTPPLWSWAFWPIWGPCRLVLHGGWSSWPAASDSHRGRQWASPNPRWHDRPAAQNTSRGASQEPFLSAPPTAASAEPEHQIITRFSRRSSSTQGRHKWSKGFFSLFSVSPRSCSLFCIISFCTDYAIKK